MGLIGRMSAFWVKPAFTLTFGCCWTLLDEDLVAPTGIEPVLSALKGPRVNQLHHGAKHTKHPTTTICRLLRRNGRREDFGSVTGARTRTLRLERAAC